MLLRGRSGVYCGVVLSNSYTARWGEDWLGRERAPWALCCRERQCGSRYGCACLSGNVPCLVSVVCEWWWRKSQYADVYSLKTRAVMVQEASLCRSIFAEWECRLKSPTIGRIDARETPIIITVYHCGDAGASKGEREIRGDNVCCMMSGSTCRTLRSIAPTYVTVLLTGKRHWCSLSRSNHCSHIFWPIDSCWMISGSSVTKTYDGERLVKLFTLGRPGKLLAFAVIDVAVSCTRLDYCRVCLSTLKCLSGESTYLDHPRRLIWACLWNTWVVPGEQNEPVRLFTCFGNGLVCDCLGHRINVHACRFDIWRLDGLHAFLKKPR